MCSLASRVALWQRLPIKLSSVNFCRMVLSFIFYSCLLFHASFPLDTPCSQEAPGGECLFDEECHGENTVCTNGRCTCPTGFEHFALDDKATVCRPAPDEIRAECQSECKPPLLCRSGKCECWQGQVDRSGKCRVTCERGKQLIGQDCVKVSRLGAACRMDKECIDPFAVCRGRRCACAQGTRYTGRGCAAVCPSGHPATQSCRRLFVNDLDILIHKSQSDSCPPGYQCLTYGKPPIGHCCPFYCPFGTADTSRSCDPGAPLDRKCRKLTHFCHSQSGPGWKVAVCCPRPCREPTPLYIGGRCLPMAHRDDPCLADEQCEGGKAMECSRGRCRCRASYRPATDHFPTCARFCVFNQVEALGDCVPSSRLGKKCLRSEQCPASAHCYYGRCKCHCGYKSETLLNSCINPDDPLNLNRLIDQVGRFFGRETPLLTPSRTFRRPLRN